MKRFAKLVLLVSGACLFAAPAAAEMYWNTESRPQTAITSKDFKYNVEGPKEERVLETHEIYDTGERPSVTRSERPRPLEPRSGSGQEHYVRPSRDTFSPMSERHKRIPAAKHAVRPADTDIEQPKPVPSSGVGGAPKPESFTPRTGPVKVPDPRPAPAVQPPGGETQTKPLNWGNETKAGNGEVKPAEEKTKLDWGQNN